MIILTLKETAKLLKTDKRTLQKRAQKGYYPSDVCGRDGRKYLFNEEALLNFIFPKENVL